MHVCWNLISTLNICLTFQSHLTDAVLPLIILFMGRYLLLSFLSQIVERDRTHSFLQDFEVLKISYDSWSSQLSWRVGSKTSDLHLNLRFRYITSWGVLNDRILTKRLSLVEYTWWTIRFQKSRVNINLSLHFAY